MWSECVCQKQCYVGYQDENKAFIKSMDGSFGRKTTCRKGIQIKGLLQFKLWWKQSNVINYPSDNWLNMRHWSVLLLTQVIFLKESSCYWEYLDLPFQLHGHFVHQLMGSNRSGWKRCWLVSIEQIIFPTWLLRPLLRSPFIKYSYGTQMPLLCFSHPQRLICIAFLKTSLEPFIQWCSFQVFDNPAINSHSPPITRLLTISPSKKNK